MPKTTKIDKTKADKRKAAIQALKDRGPVTDSKSIKELADRLELIEKLLGL